MGVCVRAPHLNRYVNGAVVSVIMWTSNDIVYLLSNNDAVVWFLHFFPHTHYTISFFFCSFWHSLCASAAVVLLMYIFSSFAVSMFVLKFFFSFIHSFIHSAAVVTLPMHTYEYMHRHIDTNILKEIIISFHLHNLFLLFVIWKR